MLAILAAVMLAAAPQHDTVFTSDGGRVLGTVVEETAQAVSLQLPDGSYRRIARGDVTRIEYADGSVSTRPAQPPAAAAPPPAYTPPPPGATPPPPPGYTPPPPPGYTPPRYYPARPPPPAYPPPAYPPPTWAEGPRHTGPIAPFWLSLGLGGMFFGGDLAQDLPVSRIYGPQMNLAFEGGFRLTNHLGLGLYADLGVGGAAGEQRDNCSLAGRDCTATTSRVGLLLRHTFEPSARVTPWFSVGTGFAQASVDANADAYGPSENVLQFSGWEIARIMAGVDLRSNQVFGVGFYAGVGFTRYGKVEFTDEVTGERFRESIPDRQTHTLVEAGLRLTLFP